MANYSAGAGMLMGFIGGNIGTIDSSLNAVIYAKNGRTGSTISATVTG